MAETICSNAVSRAKERGIAPCARDAADRWFAPFFAPPGKSVEVQFR